MRWAVGVQFLPKAREALAWAAEAAWTARRAARGEIGRPKVGFIAAAGTPVLHRIPSRFRAALPEVELAREPLRGIEAGGGGRKAAPGRGPVDPRTSP